MKHEKLALLSVSVLLILQSMLLCGTLYSNYYTRHHKIVEVEKKVIIERHYVEAIRKYPEDIIEEPEAEIIEEVEEQVLPTLVLSQTLGRVQGPQEEETYYNLPMDRVVQTMRDRGYAEADYPYYVTENGIKMLGDFIIVAADLNKYPRGTVVQTSLGQGIVCDTGEELDGVIDIAVEW